MREPDGHRRLAENQQRANLYEADESDSQSVRQEAQSQFAGSESALGKIRSGDDAPEELNAVIRQESVAWSAEISAVATGRKPLFHEDLGLTDPRFLSAAGDALRKQLPDNVAVHIQDGHLYVYNPAAQVIGAFVQWTIQGVDRGWQRQRVSAVVVNENIEESNFWFVSRGKCGFHGC
jgi:hypothetical protein